MSDSDFDLDVLFDSDESNNTTESQPKLLSIRRMIVKGGSMEAVLTLIPDASLFSRVWIPGSIKILSANCFKRCETIQSLLCESPSQLIRIESS
jgi:hypothetical protein